jgi:hypothetical protein
MRLMTKPEPKRWAVRVCKGFLFLPITIGGETRWLEHAYWLEVYSNGAWRWSKFLTEEDTKKSLLELQEDMFHQR